METGLRVNTEKMFSALQSLQTFDDLRKQYFSSEAFISGK
jgi:hypothetical protein